jgi:hypothetical protein
MEHRETEGAYFRAWELTATCCRVESRNTLKAGAVHYNSTPTAHTDPVVSPSRSLGCSGLGEQPSIEHAPPYAAKILLDSISVQHRGNRLVRTYVL